MNPNIAAILDRLTDPRQDALADAREALEQLSGEIFTLKAATDRDGGECADYLWDLACGVDQALDRLGDALTEGGGAHG